MEIYTKEFLDIVEKFSKSKTEEAYNLGVEKTKEMFTSHIEELREIFIHHIEILSRDFDKQRKISELESEIRGRTDVLTEFINTVKIEARETKEKEKKLKHEQRSLNLVI